MSIEKMDYKVEIETIYDKLDELRLYIDSNIDKVKSGTSENEKNIRQILADIEKHFDMFSEHIQNDTYPWQESLQQFGEVFKDVNMLDQNFKSLKSDVNKLKTQLDLVREHLQDWSKTQLKTNLAIENINVTTEKLDKKLDSEISSREASDAKIEKDNKSDFRWRVGTLLVILGIVTSSLITGLVYMNGILTERDASQNRSIVEIQKNTQKNYNETKDLIHNTQLKFLEKIETILKEKK